MSEENEEDFDDKELGLFGDDDDFDDLDDDESSTTDAKSASDDGVQTFNIAQARDGELDGLPTMRLVDERTAALFGQELGHAFQTQIDVSVDRIDIKRASEWTQSLEHPGCYNLVELEALGGHAMLSMEQELFFKLLELLFGAGAGIDGFDSEARMRFSAVEERVIRRVVHLFGRSMEAAWRPVIPMHVVHLRIETTPENAPISDRDDWLIITTYAVKLGDFVGEVRMAVPKSGLMKFRERLSTGRYEKRPEHKESWRYALVESVRDVDLEVVAEFGKAHTTLGELLTMQVGQVMRLSSAPEDLLTVHVSSVPKYRGRATVHHGNLAVTLESMIE